MVGTGDPLVSTVVAVSEPRLALSLRRALPLATALIVLLTWPVVFSIQPILVLFWGQLVPIVDRHLLGGQARQPPRRP